MRKILLLLLLLIQNFSVLAQETPIMPQVKAQPKEGLEVFYKNFINEFKLPSVPKGIYEVAIRLKFIVEKDGSFSNIEVVDDNLNITEEAIRVLKEMPIWNAAVYEGKYVRSSYTLPIKIKVKDPDSNEFNNKEEKKAFLKTLNANVVDTDYFNLECNCALAKSSKNDELQTEEFLLYSQDNKASYTIAFRKMDLQQAQKELETVKSDAIRQKATVKNTKFNGIKTTEISINIPNGDYVDNYRMLFLYHNQYVIAVSVVSYKTQLADLLFEHFKGNFKLKI
ncbi:energy transducer TonB [Paenimyroides baculatum]|uniref:TonB protein C-terminal n=1 Tax=Paenimyroides baculatum TaxID=2608000 RepID=A0A5M6CZF0_9FLAO|nr:hypothetical protein [Paenimyroides baculatum]KAA5538225.1 hypothetical protein F0460_01080 [Paenimyroides baculatum]